MATALARRRVTLDDFTPEAIKSPDILAFTAKTDVQIDHDFDRGDVGIEPARVRVTMKDGGVYIEQVRSAHGQLRRGRSRSPTSSASIGVCLEHAGQPISAANADALVENVARLEELQDVQDLIRLAT